jgi:hypothetical protein
MIRAIKFYWLSIKYAWKGCWTRAYEAAGFLGGGIIWVGLYLASPKLREMGLIEVPNTWWGVAGHTFLGGIASVLVAFIIIFLWRLLFAPSELYWAERDKTDTRNRAAKQYFKFGSIYSESRTVKKSDGTPGELYESVFYLVVGNNLDGGKSLKRVQTRIFHFGEPELAYVKETGATEIDIRHGEWALFQIGRIVSKQIVGLFQGATDLDDKELEAVEHNIPLGHLAFTVSSAAGKGKYNLGHTQGTPHIWNLFMIVSADDALAAQIRINIDMENLGNPVSFEPII